jgi:hypothetical protein
MDSGWVFGTGPPMLVIMAIWRLLLRSRVRQILTQSQQSISQRLRRSLRIGPQEPDEKRFQKATSFGKGVVAWSQYGADLDVEIGIVLG